MHNPILVEVTRGPLVESAHRGALAVARADGESVLALGDIRRPIYPRSAVKALQAVALVETGAADRFGFGAREIALACASHRGEERHVTLAERMLEACGLDHTALGCGAHTPTSDEAAAALIRAGREPTELHNNCSGKHAGMLATCVHCGDPVAGYLHPNHPHQQRIRGILEAFTGVPLASEVPGIDGCSAPNWAIPLSGLATAFACFITGEGAARHRRSTVERIAAACWAAPGMVAGTGRLDTRLMRAHPGEVFVKTGAEGVYCGAIPRLGLGFAVKIDDGNGRASEAVTRALVARLVPQAEEYGAIRELRNWQGTTVGSIVPASALVSGLDALRH